MPDRARFDKAGFFAAVEATRVARGLTWRQVARETTLSPSTFTRLQQGYGPDVDTMAILVDWAGIDTDRFIIRTHDPDPDPPLPILVTAFFRDPALTVTAAKTAAAVTLAAYNQLRGAPHAK
jgi:transcriptional regulator with XRE-family HTH domain